jgi:uncharacterized SAM-binding protein YcdF (DUF218 family)
VLTPRFLKTLGRVYVWIALVFTSYSVLVAFTPFAPWYARILAGNWTDSDGDVLIVLGADGEPDGLVGGYSYWRCVYAVRAWREGHFTRIVVSGGPIEGSSSYSIASSMRDFLVSSGVPTEAIFLEDRSHSTRENALFTQQLIAGWPGKKVLLTSDQHMFRALRVFRKVGLDVTPRPAPDTIKGSRSWIARWVHSWSLEIETVKIVYYAARGWI